MFDDELPRPIPPLLQPALDPLGVDEITGYIEALRAEITRAEAMIERKQGHRAAADSFFRMP